MKNRAERNLIIGIVIICCCYFIIGLFFKPIVCNDAVYGMVTLRNHLNGSDWNKILLIPAKGTQIISRELTWWAPGQYMIPYVVSKVFFVNIGTAITIISFAAVLGGFFFYYKLFKLSGISAKVVLCALLILLLQRFINIFFLQFTSSDLLLFCYTPFYVYLYFLLLKTHSRHTILKILLLTVVNLGGMFIKNSFILFEVAMHAFFIVEYFYRSKALKDSQAESKWSWYKSLLFMLPFVLAYALNYYFFLRLGTNPSQSNGLLLSASNILAGLVLPAIRVLFSSLSLSGIYGNFYNKVSLPWQVTDILLSIGLAVMGCLVYLNRGRLLALFKKDIVFRAVSIIAIMYAAFWFAFTIMQSAISNEDRLYLPATILLFPYLLNFALKTGSKLKYVYFAAIGFSVLYGVATFAYRVKKYSIDGSVLSRNRDLNGFKVYSANQGSKADLEKISALLSTRYANEYVLLPNPNIAFELNVPNKFMISPIPIVPAQLTGSQMSYLVLLKDAANESRPGFSKIYASGGFSLYRVN